MERRGAWINVEAGRPYSEMRMAQLPGRSLAKRAFCHFAASWMRLSRRAAGGSARGRQRERRASCRMRTTTMTQHDSNAKGSEIYSSGITTCRKRGAMTREQGFFLSLKTQNNHRAQRRPDFLSPRPRPPSPPAPRPRQWPQQGHRPPLRFGQREPGVRRESCRSGSYETKAPVFGYLAFGIYMFDHISSTIPTGAGWSVEIGNHC